MLGMSRIQRQRGMMMVKYAEEIRKEIKDRRGAYRNRRRLL